jgi:hypothetical protein
METRLNEISPEDFIGYARDRAGSVPEDDYYSSNKVGRHETLSFDVFIRIIYKYTERQMHSVHLNANIISTGDPELHFLCIWGIRDIGLREGKGAKYLPGYQEGTWSCIVEDALRIGILSEQVEQFRENLCLREKEDGELDDNFFCKYHDFETGL